MDKKINKLVAVRRDRDGNYIVPAEGYEIKKIETRADRITKRIAELEKELAGMKEPTEKELIQEGRMMHPYFMYRDELDYLKKELNKSK